VSDPDRRLLELAASCYERLGEAAEAARCYRDAGSHRRAADLFVSLGLYREAALDLGRSGQQDLAAWLLVHEADDPAAARAALALQPVPGVAMDWQPPARPLRQRLVLARCDVADGASDRVALPVLAEACADLARPAVRYDPYIEPWAVGLAEAVRREDQTALVFAAAVRGDRPGAVGRWAEWSREVLHAELILPAEASGGRP
jgi:hypothetical protein